MENNRIDGVHTPAINLTGTMEMFLHTKYRIIFNNRSQMDTPWCLHVLNPERLEQYFVTTTICIWISSVLCILLLGLQMYKMKR